MTFHSGKAGISGCRSITPAREHKIMFTSSRQPTEDGKHASTLTESLIVQVFYGRVGRGRPEFPTGENREEKDPNLPCPTRTNIVLRSHVEMSTHVFDDKWEPKVLCFSAKDLGDKSLPSNSKSICRVRLAAQCICFWQPLTHTKGAAGRKDRVFFRVSEFLPIRQRFFCWQRRVTLAWHWQRGRHSQLYRDTQPGP